jgi:hypothetical protein
MSYPEVARDVLAAVPVDGYVRDELEAHHNFSGHYLDMRIDWHQQQIALQLGRVGLSLEMEQTAFDSPLQKLEYDVEQIVELLRKLGPTNPRRDDKGYDAGFEFAHMLLLLEEDYAALPESEQRPELRMLEGILREELALLWRPATPLEFADHPDSGFLFDLEDPNVFTAEEIRGLSEPDRWKLIGARLSDEAAEVFQEIYESDSAPRDVQLEARCRMIDMQIRSLRIQVGVAGANREELYRQMDGLNTAYMAEIEAVWNEPEPRGIRNGLLFELTVVARERNKLIEAGENNRWVRLAMPREDRLHQDVRPLKNIDGMVVNLSSDVIKEDMNGYFVHGYQVKSESEAAYAARQKKRQARGRELVYYSEISLRHRNN